MVLDALDK